MEVNGISLDQFSACARDISRTAYAGNVIVTRGSAPLPARKNGRQRCRARLTVEDARGPGSRTSPSGLHGPYACWHAYRDVLSLAFRRFHDAVIKSGNSWRVTYRGAAGFAQLYPQTAYVVISSAFSPVTMPELCECGDAQPYVQTMPHTGTRPATADGEAATCLCSACNAIREARGRRQEPDGLLTCGLFTSRAGTLETARRQQEASDELLADPVFGPPVTEGARFGR